MPNGHEKKEYGGHKYLVPDGTSDCDHGCGCWMGPARSGGPTGLDPFGICPNNPTDGERRPGTTDYNDVVEQRISDLESKAYEAERALKKMDPSKIELAEELSIVKNKLMAYERIFREIEGSVQEVRTKLGQLKIGD